MAERLFRLRFMNDRYLTGHGGETGSAEHALVFTRAEAVRLVAAAGPGQRRRDVWGGLSLEECPKRSRRIGPTGDATRIVAALTRTRTRAEIARLLLEADAHERMAQHYRKEAAKLQASDI